MGSSFSTIDKHISCTGFSLTSTSKPTTKKNGRDFDQTRTNVAFTTGPSISSSCLTFGGCVSCPTNPISMHPCHYVCPSNNVTSNAESVLDTRHDPYKVLHCSCRTSLAVQSTYACQQLQQPVGSCSVTESSSSTPVVPRQWTFSPFIPSSYSTASLTPRATVRHLVLQSIDHSKLLTDPVHLKFNHPVCSHPEQDCHLGMQRNFSATLPRSAFHFHHHCHHRNPHSHDLSLIEQTKSTESLPLFIGKEYYSNYLLDQFRQYINTWSCSELFCLCLEYEALHEEHFIESESIKSRPKALTLYDDLRDLCDKGWCSNLYLRYRGSLYAAHSYILAIRSNAFYKLLHSAYDLGNCTCETAVLSPDLAIVFPQPAVTPSPSRHNAANPHVLSSMELTRLSLNASNLIGYSVGSTISKVPQLFDSPDLLSNQRQHVLTINTSTNTVSTSSTTTVHLVTTSTTHLIPTTTTTTTAITTNTSDEKTELVFTDYLMRLYTAKDSKLTPDKQKPDLLHCPDMFGEHSSVSLILLYQLLFAMNPKAKHPLAPDCWLVFTYPNQSKTHDLVKLPCHAGILACRSTFLRRLLTKRYKPGSKHSSDNNLVVIDGAIVPPYLGHIILHFFYNDHLDLDRIANLVSSQTSQQPQFVNLDRCHLQWHEVHVSNHPDCASCYHPKKSKGSGLLFGQEVGNEFDFRSDNTLDASHGDQTPSSVGKSNCFCSKCPFCIGRILELHPMGHILEFKRLSEACEDLLINALNLPPNYHQHERIKSTLASIDSRIAHMSSISLAVGLLDWASGLTNGLALNFPKSEQHTTDVGTANPSNHPGDSSAAHEHATQTTSHRRSTSDDNKLTSSLDILSRDDKCTSTRYVYRHAMHSLRRNFADLVRSPSLGRLAPNQIYELLDSNLIQSTELEILAALLYWAECQLEHKHANLHDKKCNDPVAEQTQSCNPQLRNSPSPRDHSNPDKSTTHHQLVSALIENPHILYNVRSPTENNLASSNSLVRPTSNSWLLLPFYDEYCLNLPTSKPLWALSSRTNPNLGHPCHLCQADQISSTAFPIAELVHSIIKQKLPDLPNLMAYLDNHHLIQLLRPAHLLTRIPHELATLLVRSHVHSSLDRSSCQSHPDRVSIRSFLSDLGSSTPNTSGAAFGAGPAAPESSDLFWISLLDSIYGRLPGSKISYRSQSKAFWAHLLVKSKQQEPTINEYATSYARCSCRWNKLRLHDRSEETLDPTSSHPDQSNTLNCSGNLNHSMLGPEFKPPRLFYPFLEEVRTRFMQKHVFHHCHLPSDSDPPNVHGPTSECTCWRSLSNHAVRAQITQSACPDSNHPPSPDLICPMPSCSDDCSTRSVGTTLATVCDLSVPEFIAKLAQNQAGHKSELGARGLCCDYRCREFANCLLSPDEWTNLIDYYVKLDREFMTSSASRHPCVNLDHMLRRLRYQALWKYGLPDSLEPLFQCRINERLFTIQQPPTHPSTTRKSPSPAPNLASPPSDTSNRSNEPSNGRDHLTSPIHVRVTPSEFRTAGPMTESVTSDRSYLSLDNDSKLVSRADQSSMDSSISSPSLTKHGVSSPAVLDYCPACQNEFERLQRSQIPVSHPKPRPAHSHPPRDHTAQPFECELCLETAQSLLLQNSNSPLGSLMDDQCNCLLGKVRSSNGSSHYSSSSTSSCSYCCYSCNQHDELCRPPGTKWCQISPALTTRTHRTKFLNSPNSTVYYRSLPNTKFKPDARQHSNQHHSSSCSYKSPSSFGTSVDSRLDSTSMSSTEIESETASTPAHHMALRRHIPPKQSSSRSLNSLTSGTTTCTTHPNVRGDSSRKPQATAYSSNRNPPMDTTW